MTVNIQYCTYADQAAAEHAILTLAGGAEYVAANGRPPDGYSTRQNTYYNVVDLGVVYDDSDVAQSGYHIIVIWRNDLIYLPENVRSAHVETRPDYWPIVVA